MITIYAWLDIRATFQDEDLHPEINEKEIIENVRAMINSLKHNKIEFIDRNYHQYIQFHVAENHFTERSKEMINLFYNISAEATGSYGVLFFWNDEDDVNYDRYQVCVSKKGKCEWIEDKYFSPCSGMIYE